MYPDPIFEDNDWSVPYPVSGAVFSRPIPGVNVDYVLKQIFSCRKDVFENLALNTPYDESFVGADAFVEWADFVLVEEGPESDTGDGTVEWERTYARVPAMHQEPSVMAYSFIGFYGTFGINIVAITGRDRFSRVVPAKIQYDYYLLDDETTLDDVPIEQEQKYYVGTESNLTDYLADSPPFTVASNPTRTDYEAMIAAGEDIVARASQTTRWMGNIVRRETIYVKAL
jgi:hypothetical protein